MNIPNEISKLKRHISAFQPIAKYEDIAREAEAYFALSHKLEGLREGLREAEAVVIFDAAGKHLVDECMHLLAALWNTLPSRGYEDVVMRWEEKIEWCIRNFEYAKALYLFVLERLGIAEK